MNIPEALVSLFDEGIIDRVVRPLMSGKEAQVFLVECGGELRVAKVYKNADHRSFKKRGDYTQGRKTRNSRDQRAVDKRSKHGRAEEEAAWKSAEVDIIHRLHVGGVRVPIPHAFVDGVLVMECVVDPDGDPAPRLGDLAFDAEGAKAMYDRVMREVVRMLAVGVVHGDLSDFNVLVSGDEPILIDFPQAVDTASNTNARKLLLRDVDNIHRFLARWAPKLPRLPFAEEMWALHENNALTADTVLTGRFRETVRATSGDSVIGLIRDAERDERKRREALGDTRSMPFDARRPIPSGPSPRASTSSPATPSNARSAPRGSERTSSPPRSPNQHSSYASNRDSAERSSHGASSSRPSNRESAERSSNRDSPQHSHNRDSARASNGSPSQRTSNQDSGQHSPNRGSATRASFRDPAQRDSTPRPFYGDPAQRSPSGDSPARPSNATRDSANRASYRDPAQQAPNGHSPARASNANRGSTPRPLYGDPAQRSPNGDSPARTSDANRDSTNRAPNRDSTNRAPNSDSANRAPNRDSANRAPNRDSANRAPNSDSANRTPNSDSASRAPNRDSTPSSQTGSAPRPFGGDSSSRGRRRP